METLGNISYIKESPTESTPGTGQKGIVWVGKISKSDGREREYPGMRGTPFGSSTLESEKKGKLYSSHPPHPNFIVLDKNLDKACFLHKFHSIGIGIPFLKNMETN